MSLLSDAVKKEIEEVVKENTQKLSKEEMKEIVNAIMPQMEIIVEKQVKKYFRHLASLVIYDELFKEGI